MKRALPTRKLADTLLWRWCEFHDHGPEDEIKCHAWRDSLIKKKGWQKEWEKCAKEQMQLNLTLKRLDVNTFPSESKGKPQERTRPDSRVSEQRSSVNNSTAALEIQPGKESNSVTVDTQSHIIDISSGSESSDDDEDDEREQLKAASSASDMTRGGQTRPKATPGPSKTAPTASRTFLLPRRKAIDSVKFDEDDDDDDNDSSSDSDKILIGRSSLRSATVKGKECRRD